MLYYSSHALNVSAHNQGTKMHTTTAQAVATAKTSAATFQTAADALRAAKNCGGRGETVRYEFMGWEVIARGTYVECKAPQTMWERGAAAVMAVNSIEHKTETALPTAESLLAACQRVEDRISRAVAKCGAAE